MWGSFSLGSFVGVALLVALFVALLFFASPLLAILIAVVVLVAAIPVMSAMRRRSRAAEDEHLRTRDADTPEGKPTSPTGAESTGAPVSGEGT
jgi:membrane protein implicated in regulation of membrane protease activity